MEIKAYIYLLVITEVLQFLTAHLYRNFKGSSKVVLNYLAFCAGVGGLATLGIFIWACFLTTWWIPIAAYGAAFIIKTLIPPIPIVEIVASWIFPISLIVTIILLLMQS